MNARFSKRALRFILMWVCASLAGYAPAQSFSPDPLVNSGLGEISAARIQADIEKLVAFHTRNTLSREDEASVASGKGIGAAREWIKSELERYSRNRRGSLTN